VDSDGGFGGGRIVTLGTAIYNLNTAGYGAPTASVDDDGVTLTNANYNGHGIEISVDARQIGRAFNLVEAA
jgi:hypothetical protein